MQLYRIRLGQAGARDNYDLLSSLGRRQAHLLGEYFRSAGVSFRAAYAGSMRRQRETAEIVLGEMTDAPEIRTDARWNEFNLETLWKTLTPRLLAENGHFVRDYHMVHALNPNITRVLTSYTVVQIRVCIRLTHT